MKHKIIEAIVLRDRYSLQKQRLRETKKRQIEAIDNRASQAKSRIRDQYKRKIEAINRGS